MSTPQTRPSSPPRRSRGRLLLVVVGLLLGAVAGYGLLHRAHPAPEVVRPTASGESDPVVRRLIEERIRRAEAAPRDAGTHGDLGLVYEANSLWHEARGCFANAATLDPEDPWWRYHQAIAMWQVGDVDPATAMLVELAEQMPDAAPVQHRLAAAELDAGKIDIAMHRFRRVIDLAPSAPEGYVGLADALLRNGEHAEAAAELRRALSLDGGYKTAHYLLGLAYRGLGESEAAEIQLRQGMNATPRFIADPLTPTIQKYTVNLAAQLTLAARAIRAGRAPAAAALLETALVDRPRDVNVINNLASAYMDMGQSERARALLLRADEIDDSQFATSINLAACLLTMNDPAGALEHADEAVARGPEVGQAYYIRARALAALSRYDDAITDLERAIGLDVRNPDAHLALGELCYLQERFTESRRHYENAARLMPDSLPVHVSLGGLYLRLNELDLARASLAAAERLAPDHPRVQNLRRRLAEREGR